MSVKLPWAMPFPIDFQVTGLTSNPQGQTVVDCTLAGNKIRTFFLDKNVDVVGADMLINDIRDNVLDILAQSLEVSES